MMIVHIYNADTLRIAATFRGDTAADEAEQIADGMEYLVAPDAIAHIGEEIQDALIANPRAHVYDTDSPDYTREDVDLRS